MTSDEITALHTQMMKAYRSTIYWGRRDAGDFRDHEKRAYREAKRKAASDKYYQLSAAYHAAIKRKGQ